MVLFDELVVLFGLVFFEFDVDDLVFIEGGDVEEFVIFGDCFYEFCYIDEDEFCDIFVYVFVDEV